MDKPIFVVFTKKFDKGNVRANYIKKVEVDAFYGKFLNINI